MDPIQASVVENQKPDLGVLALARLKRRHNLDITVEPQSVDPLKPPQPALTQFDVVLSGGDAPSGHILASSRERAWAERMAAALNKSRHPRVEEAEKQARGLIAVGY